MLVDSSLCGHTPCSNQGQQMPFTVAVTQLLDQPYVDRIQYCSVLSMTLCNANAGTHLWMRHSVSNR